jgi:hypothetical protein
MRYIHRRFFSSTLLVLATAAVLAACSHPASIPAGETETRPPATQAVEIQSTPTPFQLLDSEPPSAGDQTVRPLSTTPAVTFTAILLPSSTPTPPASPTPTETLTPSPLSPTPTPEIPVRFAVIGDYGLAGQPAADVSRLVKSWNPDFIITTGDNNYPDGAAETIDENIGQYYHEFISPYRGAYGPGGLTNRFFPTLGNHDYQTLNAQPYFEYFTLPGNQRYYDFTWGPLHLFALNSDSREPDGVGRSSIQAAWLQERLAASEQTWKIVYMHHPPYSSGYHGAVTWTRWPHKEWGASAVLSGHDHIYERLMVDGLPYFINGLGGGPRYPLGEIQPESEVRFRDEHGAMLVTATSDRLTFEFFTRHGERIDSYTLSLSTPTPLP